MPGTLSIIFTIVYLVSLLFIVLYLCAHCCEYLLIPLGIQPKLKWSKLRSLQLDLGSIVFCLAVGFSLDLSFFSWVVVASFAVYLISRIEDKFNTAWGLPRRRIYYKRPTYLSLVTK